MTLLIVDDNEAMRRLMREIAGKFCDRVFECADGAEALEAYRAHRPDVVLMDVEMKTLDGIRATAEILGQYPQARIIIVTRHNNSMTREAAEKAGACAFLAKENLFRLRDLLGNTTFLERGNER